MSGLRERLQATLAGLRPSSPGAGQPLRRLRVAAVVDEFTRSCLAPEVTLLSLDARLWRLQLPAFAPDLLFVESAWRGAHDSWRKRVASYPGRRDGTLAALVRACAGRGIPTVFWNKEDPVHFDRFIDAARRFDHVFTTGIERADDYVRRGGLRPDRVHPLLFAAQPALHYPGAAPREDVVCFAGSYGEPELAARRVDLEHLLDGAAAFDLRILDRNSGRGGDPAKRFPARYQRFVHPAVDYQALGALQRRYKVFLNVNSIQASSTMFSRRVFELLASGAAVVSSPNVGMTALFGDLVPVATSAAAARDAIGRLLGDADYYRDVTTRAAALVAAGHTYERRLRQVLAAVGLRQP